MRRPTSRRTPRSHAAASFHTTRSPKTRPSPHRTDIMGSLLIKGIVQVGLQHFTRRMTEHSHVFEEAFGCLPYPGTINVRVDRLIRIQPTFSIRDPIDAQQELLIERCLINGLAAFRIRPSVIRSEERRVGKECRSRW